MGVEVCIFLKYQMRHLIILSNLRYIYRNLSVLVCFNLQATIFQTIQHFLNFFF